MSTEEGRDAECYGDGHHVKATVLVGADGEVRRERVLTKGTCRKFGKGECIVGQIGCGTADLQWVLQGW